METSSFRRLMHQRFDSVCKGKLERDAVIGIIALAEDEEREEEIEAFLLDNPTATLRETIDYAGADLINQRVEIVDDDEMDEDWEE